MEAAKEFSDLIVWEKAHRFVLSVYNYTSGFPKAELYGLSSQFRRASVSIASNISEGFGKKSKADKIRFLNISQGSLAECKYYLILSQDLGYGAIEELRLLSVEVSKLLTSYSKAIDLDRNK